MYKILSSLVFVAFFFSASAFATNIVEPIDANQASLCQNAPENMLTVTLTQTGAGQATGVWTADTNGPFIVTLFDLTTGVRVHQSVNPNLFQVFSNLVVKHTYRLTVGDLNGQNLLHDDEIITH